MTPPKETFRAAMKLVLVSLLSPAFLLCGTSVAQSVLLPPSYGPYNAIFRSGGAGLTKPVDASDPILQAASPWTLYCWFQNDGSQTSKSGQSLTLLAGVGNPLEEYSRYLGVRDGKPIFWVGEDNVLSSTAELPATGWHFVSATFDGSSVRLYSDGQLVANGKLAMGRVSANLEMAPDGTPGPNEAPRPDEKKKDLRHFGGRIAWLTLLRTALNETEIRQLAGQVPDPSLIAFEEGSKPWPIQTKEQAGYRAPQDPSSLPKKRRAFFSSGCRAASAFARNFEPRGENQWAIEGGWKLTPAPKVSADGSDIAQPGFDSKDWWAGNCAGYGSHHHDRSRSVSRLGLWFE